MMSASPSTALAQLPVVLELTVDARAYKIVLPHAATDYIQKKLVADCKPYELEMLDDLRSRVTRGALVLDIGANIGNHTLYLATVAGCQVEAFEPNSALCSALRESVRLNGLDHTVHVHQTGLGRSVDRARFGVDTPDNLGGQHLALGDGDLEVAPLDSFSFDRPVQVMKIDVEGMELDVLQGATQLIARDRPLLYVECTTEAEYRVIARYLETLDYTYWDTFNATPTHLFVPAERMTVEQRLQHLQMKVAQNDYRANMQLRDARTALNEANLKYRSVTEQIATLRQKVAQEEAARQAAATLSSDLQARLDLANQALDVQKRDHHDALDALTRDLKAQIEVTRTAEKQGIKADAELETLRSQLDVANLKYRELTQRYGELKERLGQLEASRQAAASRQLELQTQLDVANRALEAERVEREIQIAALRLELKTQFDATNEAQKMQVRAETSLDMLRNQLEIATGALKDERNRHQEEVTALSLDVRTHSEAYQAAQMQLVRTESAVDGLKEKIDVLNQKYSDAIQLHAALKERLQREQTENQEASTRLVEAHDQLRQAEVDMLDLKERLQREQTAHQEAKTHLSEAHVQLRRAEDEARKMSGQLNDESLKYRDLIKSHDDLKSQVRQHEVERQAHSTSIEKEKVELLRGKQALSRAEREIERLKNQKLAAENQVAKTRAMVSFQVGYAIVHGLKSVRGTVGLPKTLWNIYRKHKARRIKPDNQPGPEAMFRPAATVPRIEHKSSTLAPNTDSPGMTAERLKSLRVACIMDEFTFSSYQPECNLLQLTPTNYRDELEGFKPEMLFIESAWRGKDGLWGSKVGHLSQEVQDILAWCRAQKVPTVFWNKEDPVHFETFLTTARLFDHVFTTDIDCIHRYKAALGHERVYLLPFAAQPKLSNPIETYKRKDAFCFAGAYYVRYPERTRDLGNFVSQLPEFRPVDIYDRNYGKDDPNYQFPPEYQPFIVGNLPFDQIDKAYKGYRYAINLNSIKQSQSMFARRVYELLASNTVTVSNFSRGLRLMFGDLVVTTDSGEEIVRRLRKLCEDDVQMRKYRLAGLRKVMASHTYQDRLAYVVEKVKGSSAGSLLPSVIMLAYAKNQEQFDALLASYQQQTHAERRLVVVVPNGFVPDDLLNDGRIELISADQAAELTIGEVANGAAMVAGIVPDDYYGANYLFDLAIASRYSSAGAFGKGTHYAWSPSSGLQLAFPGQQYHKATSLPARCSAARTEMLAVLPLRKWVTSLYVQTLEAAELLCIDEFNYCKNGRVEGFDRSLVDDLDRIDHGLGLAELMSRSEQIVPEETVTDTAPMVEGKQLAAWFKPPQNRGYTCTVDDAGWEFNSTLPDGKHEYLYAATDLRPVELGFNGEVKFHLDLTPGLNLQVVLLFLDAQKQRISHIVKSGNRNHDALLPIGTEWVRLGIRIYGSGGARINGLVLGHRSLRPAEVLGRSAQLVLTNHYPSYDDLYRNGFVHSRVAAYAEHGVNVDVFRLRKDEALSYHEFHNVDIITGSQEALQKLLAGGHCKIVLVHFLDEAMWEVLRHHIDRIRVIVWVHGAEIQPWHRREYNYENEEQLNAAKEQSEKRMRFWRSLLRDMPSKLQLVFVSKYFAEEVMEDIGFRLPEDKYQIIHNPIDTDLFAYHPKPAEQRMKILSIRPYASRKYANDLSVQTILLLSTKPWFNELEFRMVGDGKLFDEVLEPVKRFGNVILERRFLSQPEIARMHREYGVFLCPTRMDAQGVSRDEAMSSGLVPVTNAVTAIPEFVDESCGILAGSDDASMMAEGIAEIVDNPDIFMNKSISAAARVRSQSAKTKLILIEIGIILSE